MFHSLTQAAFLAVVLQAPPEPTDAQGFLARGHEWYRKADWARALADYSEAIRLDPQNAYAYFSRGCVRIKNRDWKTAIDDLNEAVRLDPKHAQSILNRGNAWLWCGDADRAIADTTEALRLEPGVSYAFAIRGSAWSNKGEYEKANDDATEAVRLDPKSAFAFEVRGVIRRARGDYAGSNEDLTEAIRLAPKSPVAYTHRAMNWAASADPKFRDAKRAMEDAKKACELTEWKSPHALEAYAAACAAGGDFAEAVKWQKKVAEDEAYTKSFLGRQALARVKLYESEMSLQFTANPPAGDKKPE